MSNLTETKEGEWLASSPSLRPLNYYKILNELFEENTKLKELLKRARGLMNYTKDWACSDATEEMITKINQALGEDK